jgi:FkbM family methyltransferase
MPFYSQHGEDLVIDAAFVGEPSGFFVEVGCIDGRRFSNTLFLEERGWRGLCVEAHPAYIDLLRRNRPRCRVIHCAVGDRDADSVTFFANARGSLSTLSSTKRDEYERDYARWVSGYVEERVPLRTLSSIFDEQGVGAIDVLSVDVEGADAAAIRGLDLSRWRPRLIVVEADDAVALGDIDSMLLPAGYTRACAVTTNHFYFADAALARRIAGQTLRGVVIHTQHPLDDTGDVSVPVEIALPPSPPGGEGGPDEVGTG